MSIHTTVKTAYLLDPNILMTDPMHFSDWSFENVMEAKQNYNQSNELNYDTLFTSPDNRDKKDFLW